MTKGIKVLLCIITILLITIAKRGVPVKFKKYDSIIYLITFVGLLMIVGYFD